MTADLAGAAEEASVVLTELEPGIRLITLNRPHRLNALTYGMLAQLFAAFDDIDADAECRAVILTGAGRGFCAGLDLKELEDAPGMEGLGPAQAGMRSQNEWWTRLIPRMRSMRVPVIAAVNGAAAGGGMVLALAADLRIASSEARFHDAFLKIGVSGCELGLSWMLPRLVGMSRAADLMLTGRQIDARYAERIGLVLDVVDPSELLDTALAKCREIATNSPFAVWMTKETMWATLETPGLDAAIKLETRTQVMALMTADAKEQMTSFIEKRAPRYTNR